VYGNPFLMRENFAPMTGRPARSALYDWSMAIVSLWLSGGILIDAWYHFHSTVDTFFEPAHALLYAGLLASYVFTAIAIAIYRNRGYPLARALPPGYELAAAGLAVTLVGGVLDMIKHALFGFEEGFDALVSPSHLLIGAGMFLIITGPIKSALRGGDRPRSLVAQLPMLLALASMMELIHWGTQFVFLSGAERINAPYPPTALPHDTLTLIALQYYKQGIGLLAVIVQSVLISAFAVFTVRRIAPAAGALVVLFVAGNAFVAAAHANEPAQFWAVVIASALAAAGGELYRIRPAVVSEARWNAFAFTVPVVYWAVLLAVLGATMGLWWTPDVIGGSIVFAGLAGLFVGAMAGNVTPERLVP
jgi:hypothetical protein